MPPRRLLISAWVAAVFLPALARAAEPGADDAFSSHLPLLVFASPSDAGAPVSLRLIDDAGGANRPHGAATLSFLAEIAPEGSGGKHGMTLRLVTPDGKPRTVSLLGMPEASVWSLIGSNLDRAMVRTYLAHLLAEGMRMKDCPKMRFCEVFSEDGETYQGLYLLAEHIEEGVWMSPAFLSGKEYAAVGGGAKGAPDFGFSAFRGDAASRAAARKGLEEVKAELGSDDGERFFGYRSALDVASFIDAHILNSVLLNLHDEKSFVFHRRSKNGRIGLSPRWTFDECLDNSVEPEKGDRESFWFERLFVSADFLERYRSRYYGLLHGPFAPESLDRLVDGLGDYLGPAFGRDWRRWSREYGEMAAGPVETDAGEWLIRATASPEQDLLKIKHQLRLRSNYIAVDLEEQRQEKTLIGIEHNTKRNFLVASLFLLFFFASVWYARRKM